VTFVNQLDTALDSVRDFLKSFEPGCYTGEDAAKLVVTFSHIKRCASAGMRLSARRVEETRLHEREGYKTAGSWLADKTGESIGEAADALNTARTLENHPEIQEAFRDGGLSDAQAKEVASAAAVNPEETHRLLDEARKNNLGDLKKRCSAVRAVAGSLEDEVRRHERVRKARFLRSWADSEGVGHVNAQMTLDSLAILRSCLGSFEAQVFDRARKEGRHESHQAYMVDALLAMAQASTSASGAPSRSADPGEPGSEDDDPLDQDRTDADFADADFADADEDTDDDLPDSAGTKCTRCKNRTREPRPLVRIRVDGDALLRGYTEDGETCEVPGLGAVPVALARSVLDNAILELIVTRGTDVATVVSDSRYVRRALRIALEERDKTCVVPGCHVSDPLERDHWQVDYAKNGPTELDNLARLCVYHHRLRTHEKWELFGPPGQWRFEKPPGAEDPPDAGEPGTESRANDPPTQDGLF
jgi:hypothetical protein